MPRMSMEERGALLLLCTQYRTLHTELDAHLAKLERGLVRLSERERHVAQAHQAHDFLTRFGEMIMETAQHTGVGRE